MIILEIKMQKLLKDVKNLDQTFLNQTFKKSLEFQSSTNEKKFKTLEKERPNALEMAKKTYAQRKT